MIYLLPYMLISYYKRFALPLVGVKVLLIIWGTDRLFSFQRHGDLVASSPCRG